MVHYILDSEGLGSELMLDDYKRPPALNSSHNDESATKIVDTLPFRTMDYREGAIPKTNGVTFRWMFQQPRCQKDGTPLWTDFPRWLQDMHQQSALESFQGQNPMLQLEDLTEPDIQLYVCDYFKASEGFGEHQVLYPEQTKKLLDSIVEKARGVFLWVSVVVRNLLVSLQEGNTLSDLQANLDGLPDDLSKPFRVM
ncbi:hypothetical protein F4679DRAFT_580649 [Xylaria curta]|nr:hypothetical protein F4679DRAFT_580649 [Xylaria curta]